ncbi:MAG: hypothetical protein IPL87_05115 [Candidatus Moraniibacteriota bacterium]|nr:MAG: hypothetical protein IPL87_05115 [Candidatus Moranbacteria bacterium]
MRVPLNFQGKSPKNRIKDEYSSWWNNREKIIIRHIKEKSFRGWMRAYEQHDKWFDSGFDYVPIEPIQSFAFRENAVDVYAGVFDIDLKHWLSLSGQRFKNELLEMRERITSVLQSMKIRHGDLHLGNFFVVFERNGGST